MSDTERVQGIRDEIEVLENDRDLIGSADRESPTQDGLQPDSGEHENARFVARIEPATGTVAVHDKELGVDQHTPIDAAGKLNGGNGGAARSPEHATRDGLSASFAAAKNITAEKLGDTARTFTAQTESGNYRGEIIGETELHVLQRLSPQSAVAHMKNLLDSAPKIGENVGIGYVNQVGSVKELRDRSRVRELAR